MCFLPISFIYEMLLLIIFLIYVFSFIYFIYSFLFWLRWVFVAVHGLSLVEVSGGYPSLRCMDFSLQQLLLLQLQSTGYRRAGFSSCGAWAQ